MKAIQCELCGATDIVKDGDFFVCQSCGMKYTPESAKKMMVEGVVQVEGTVKVDNTQQIENFLSLARKAHDSDNEKEAEDYANKVLEIEPTNYEALYLKGIAAGWQTTGGNNRIPEAIDYFSQAIANCPEDANVDELKKQIAADISKLSLAMINLRCNNYIQFPSSENASSIVTEAANSIILTMKLILSCGVEPNKFKADAALVMNAAAVQAWKTIWSDYTDDKPLLPLGNGIMFQNYKTASSSDRSLYAIPSKYDWNRFTDRGDGCISVIEAAINIDDNDDEEDITRYENLIYIAEKVRDSCSIGYISGSQYVSAKWAKEYAFTDSAIAARNKKIAEWQSAKADSEQRIRQSKINEYWDAHQEERASLEASVKQLKEDLIKLKSDEQYAATKVKISSLSGEIEIKEKQLSALGILDRKAKKELKSEIESLRSEKDNLVKRNKSKEDVINDKEKELAECKSRLENPIA